VRRRTRNRSRALLTFSSSGDGWEGDETFEELVAVRMKDFVKEMEVFE
jgi:hypothetical protein